MPGRNAAWRVRERVREWLRSEGRGSKTRLASHVAAKYGTAKSLSWVTSIQRAPDDKGQDIRLKDLDDIAECMGVPPGDLVRGTDRNYLELTMAETRLIGYYRLMPETVRLHWLHFLDHVFQRYKEQSTPVERKRPRPHPRRPPSDRAVS